MGAIVRLGRCTIACVVAASAEEQQRGLQGVTALAEGEGMLFPYRPERDVVFHMGQVAFPIDLVFARRGEIVRVVHDARPGARERWSERKCSAVIEVPGGFCARNGVEIGDPYHEGREEFPGEPTPSRWHEQWGYQPSDQLDGVVGPSVRQSQIVDQDRLIDALGSAIQRGAGQLSWQADFMNGGATESTFVPVDQVAAWMPELTTSTRDATTAALATRDGLGILADAFVLAGLADQGRVADGGVVLFRGRS